MSSSWFFYAPVTVAAAKRAVDSAYKALGKVVGSEVAEEIEVGDDLDPAMLGVWPGLSASASVPNSGPAKDDEDDEGYEEGEGVEAAAIALLATCKSAVRIDGPAGFDPALVTAARAICASLGSCVFTDDPGTALVTSETLLKKIAVLADLVTAMKDGDDLAGGDDEGDEEDDEDEDDEDEDEEAGEEAEPEPTAAEAAEARPEVIRSTLAEIAQNPRARRKAGELLSGASDAIGAVAERLARAGVETDAAVAKALNMKEPDVLKARLDLARLLRRLEG